MAQAIMDPEEVRRFASELKRFNEDIQVKTASLQARFARHPDVQITAHELARKR